MQERAFPAEAVRDLLGIVRAMYASAKAGGAPPLMLRRIARAGTDLARALELASAAPLGSDDREAARRRADAAAVRVGDLVDLLTPAEPLVTAARLRVSGTRVALRKKRPER